MLKYLNTRVVFQEVPDEITLAINITRCPYRCKGCHSPELWEDTGTELTFHEVDKLIKENTGITCVCLMGGNTDTVAVHIIAHYIKTKHNLKVAWYSGGSQIPSATYYSVFDYLKIGPYVEELGGLTSPTTNQRFYQIEQRKLIDITYKFNGNIS